MSANVDIRAEPSADQAMQDWLETATVNEYDRLREAAEEAQAAAAAREAKHEHLKRIAALGGKRGGHVNGKVNRNGMRHRPKRSPLSPWRQAGFPGTDEGRRLWREAGRPEPGRSPVGISTGDTRDNPRISSLDYAMQDHDSDEGR